LPVEKISSFFACLAGVVQSMLILAIGPLTSQVCYIFIVFLLDLLLGVQLARKQNTFSRKYFFQKTIEKVMVYTVWVVLGHSADVIVKLPDILRSIVLVTLLGQELLSALRSTKELGYAGLANSIQKGMTSCLSKTPEENFKAVISGRETSEPERGDSENGQTQN
jgi:phage-related holin